MSAANDTTLSQRCARIALCAALAQLCFGCLEAGIERPGYSPALRDRDARIASVEDDVVLRQRIGANDGVDETVALRTGYVGGREVRYWDFGDASGSAEPVWLFRRRGDDGAAEEIGHPDLIDSVPGDSNYSPFRVPFLVFVTDAYDGERITSVQALEDAAELGLIEEPESMGVAVNWPVVMAATQLEMGDGEDPLTPIEVYYRGRIATHFQLGDLADGADVFPIERGSVAASNVYRLRRQNEANALDEALWRMDLNGDGDTHDSNAVFAVAPGDEGYTSLWQPIEVTVAPGHPFGESRAESDLFERQAWGLQAVSELVVSFEQADTLSNRKIVHVP